MSISSPNAYFADQVMTASPERLQLMLLEAALRSARKAEEFLAAGTPVPASAELANAEAIMTELVSSLRKELAPTLVAQVSAVYGFVLQSLCDAHLTDDVAKVRDAVRVLEVETETWRLVCGRNASAAATEPPAPRSTPAPHISFDAGLPTSGGFVFEA
ncbi:MAG: flagellar protein FliS [Planctomycetaceae bacterium]|nr:flagellar protein FliS [Planctomycetaceae bacterium]